VGVDYPLGVTSLAGRQRFALRPSLPEAAPVAVLGVLLALAVSAGVAAGLGAQGPSLWPSVAAGVGLMGVLALAIWRYDAAVAFGLLLLGIVRFEPAPVDGVMAVVMAVAVVTGRFDLRSAPLWANGLVGVFLAFNLLSCIEAVKPGRAAAFMSITVYLCLLGLWTSGYVRTVPRARLVFVIWLGVALVSAVAATLALYVAFPGSTLLANSFGDRAQGLFKDPNVYGPFLVPVAILVLHELLEPRLLRIGRTLKLVALGILVLGVTVSYSRAAWLNLAVAFVVMLAVLPLRRGGTRRAGALVLTLVACLGAAAATVSLTGSSSFFEERAHLQSYDSQRFGAQRSGIEISETHPIGVGPGQFETVSPISAHSTYIRAGAEEGVLGLAALLGLLIGTLIVACRNVILGRGTAGLSSTALLAAWVGLLANSVFVDTLHWRHLWILAGLIWAGSLIPRPEEAQASSSAGALSPT
jgi:O-antigen ligase